MAIEATEQRGPSHRNNIDALRLVGALAVLVGHAFILSSADGATRDAVSEAIADVAAFNLGMPGLGLATFFAISGYLVAASFQRRGALAYVEGRLLRIYPALWLVIGLTIAVGAVVSTFPPQDFLASRRTHDYLLGSATLVDLKYLLPGVFESNPTHAVNGSLWTLPVEMKMYGLVFVAGIAGILGRRAWCNLALAALVGLVVLWPDFVLMAEPDHQQIATFFLAGLALYVNRDLLPLRGAGVAVLALAAAALSWTPAYPLAFALAFAYAVLWLGFTRRIRLPDFARYGDLSYGSYLYAFPVTQLWISAVGQGSPWLVLCLTLATTLPLAYASWHLVETPALRLKGRLSGAKLTGRSVIVRASE